MPVKQLGNVPISEEYLEMMGFTLCPIERVWFTVFLVTPKITQVTLKYSTETKMLYTTSVNGKGLLLVNEYTNSTKNLDRILKEFSEKHKAIQLIPYKSIPLRVAHDHTPQ